LLDAVAEDLIIPRLQNTGELFDFPVSGIDLELAGLVFDSLNRIAQVIQRARGQIIYGFLRGLAGMVEKRFPGT
jgi:hypothetical protein